MAISKPNIKSELIGIMSDIDEANKAEGATIESVQEQYASKISDWVDTFLKSQKVTIPSGAITVSGANGGGAVTCTNTAAIVLENVIG